MCVFFVWGCVEAEVSQCIENLVGREGRIYTRRGECVSALPYTVTARVSFEYRRTKGEAHEG